jgi:hypothetical protein
VTTVPSVDASACKSREEWARLFIARNPELHALAVVFAYAETEIAARFDPLHAAEVEAIQAELGTAKPTERAGHADDPEPALAANHLRLTHAELSTLPDDELAMAVASRLHARAAATSPQAVEVVRVAMSVDAEIRGGGFDQLFSHAAEDLLSKAPGALVTLGAEEAAAIVVKATSLFRASLSPEAVEAPEGSRDADLDPFDAAYYAALPRGVEGRSLESRVAAYVRANVEAF